MLPILVLESDMVLRELWECMNISKLDSKHFFVCAQIYDNIISAYRPVLKTGMENYIVWSEIGAGFGEPSSSTLPPRILRSPPPLTGTPLKLLETNNSNTIATKGLKTQTGRRQPAGYLQV